MQIEVGALLEGKITSITSFGAFVSLPEGKTGMVHISEISTSYVRDIHDYLKEGQQVKVKVISVDPNGKIGLSVKRAVADNAVEKQSAEKMAVNPAARDASSQPQMYFRPNSGSRRQSTGDAFEDMMNKFKAASDEKISDLKRVTESKRSSPGFSRKNSNKF